MEHDHVHDEDYQKETTSLFNKFKAVIDAHEKEPLSKGLRGCVQLSAVMTLVAVIAANVIDDEETFKSYVIQRITEKYKGLLALLQGRRS